MGCRRGTVPSTVGPLVFASYSGLLGGAERVLLDWAAAAPPGSVLACPSGPLADAARRQGMTVLTLRGGDLELRGGARVAGRAGAALAVHAGQLRRLVRGLDPALVVAWGMRPALACATVPGLRFAFAHHDFLPAGRVGAAVRWAARRAALVTVPSAAVAADLGDVAVPVAVVAPGVEAARWSAIGPPPPGPPEVLVLGALTAWKRPELALEIVARARATVPELRLRFVGGPLTEADQATAEAVVRRAAAPDLAGAVTIVGPVADPAGELARATCLLHCAEREPFGLVVLEAMAAGRPVVVPAAAGPAEIVDPTCGIRYPPGDAAAGAAGLAEVVGEPALARTMGAAGRRRATAQFGLQRSRERFAEALAPLVGAVPAVGPVGSEPCADNGAAPLTILTVTHNSAADLQRLLDSARRWLPGVPVVVVDSGSTDASVAVARGGGGGGGGAGGGGAVTVIELGDNVGFGRACNRGLAEVVTPATALLNPDVELLDGSLAALAAEALREDRPPRLLAPRVLDGDGGIQDTVHPAPGSVADLVRAVVPGALVGGRPGRMLAPWRSAAPRRVGWAVGCALVAATTTLRDLGPFDESLFLYGEDLELGLRAAREGVQTWLWPAARVVHHRAHASARAFGGEPFERLARARHDAVARGRGAGWARLDDRAQALTFTTRIVLRRLLGRSAGRERRQLAAVRGLRR